MSKLQISHLLCFISIFIIHCSFAQQYSEVTSKIVYPWYLKVGAQRTELYFPSLKNKNVVVVANQTSRIKNTHLVDSLVKSGIKVVRILCPEHGFRGEAEAGGKIENGEWRIEKKQIPIISLYGKNKKPTKEDLKDVDIVIYDIQDVGVRFFTYISTLHYVMEACGENNIPLIVLDRPDPNGYFVDGPVLEEEFRSFVGIDPVPIVYGMTVAEYARMLNGEGWLEKGVKCELTCIQVTNYKHSYYYQLPLKPSPNLPDMEAIYLYPSLGLFEGTIMSVGRGTEFPFEVIGHPDLANTNFSFTPKSIKGMSINPPYNSVKCNGYYLKDYARSYIKNLKKIYLYWLMESYKELKGKGEFFNPMFDKLAGTDKLRKQIINGASEDEIKNSWEDGITRFKKIRRKYLLYTDFE